MSLVTLWVARKSSWGEPVKEKGYEVNVSPNKRHAMVKIGDVIHEWNMDIEAGESVKDFHKRVAESKRHYDDWLQKVTGGVK